MSKRLLTFLSVVFLLSCSNRQRIEVKHSNLILGLASTVSLPVESPAIINLNDYVLEIEILDSVSVKKPFSASVQTDKANLSDLFHFKIFW